MKSLIALALLFSFSAQAIDIISVKLDAPKKNLLVELVYSGDNHPDFQLKLGKCDEDFKVFWCLAKITNKNSKPGKTRNATAVFNLNELGLDHPYFKGAIISIFDDKDTNRNKYDENNELAMPRLKSVILP